MSQFKERNPGLFRARDMLKENIPPLKWLIPGVLSAEGVTYFIGRPKLGKTNTAFNIAVDIATGKTAFGNIPLDGAKGVLYCLLEGDRKKRRANRMLKLILNGSQCPHGLQIFTTETFPLIPGAIAKLEDILSHNQAIKLVIIDRFIQIRQPEKQVNYNKDMEDVQAIRDVAGTVDNLLFLDRKENSAHAKIKVQGRDVDENVFLTSFDRRTKRLTITGSGYLPNALQKVYYILVSNKVPMTVKELSEELDIDTDAVKKRIKRLEDRGKTFKVGRGKYTVEKQKSKSATLPMTAPHSKNRDNGLIQE